MALVVRWYLRTALVMFVLALAAGMLQALGVAGLTPVYFHLLMVGWVTQLIFGVGFWMFPKYSAERPRGSEALGWACYGLLNTGLLLRVAAEPWQSMAPGPLPGVLLAVSAGLQWLAGMAFVVNTWPRLKER